MSDVTGIDFNQPLQSIFGESLRETDEEGGQRPLLLGKVAVAALMAQARDEKVSQDDVMRRWKLAQRLVNGTGFNVVDLKSEERVLIKQCAERAGWTIPVRARLEEILG